MEHDTATVHRSESKHWGNGEVQYQLPPVPGAATRETPVTLLHDVSSRRKIYCCFFRRFCWLWTRSRGRWTSLVLVYHDFWSWFFSSSSSTNMRAFGVFTDKVGGQVIFPPNSLHRSVETDSFSPPGVPMRYYYLSCSVGQSNRATADERCFFFLNNDDTNSTATCTCT